MENNINPSDWFSEFQESEEYTEFVKKPVAYFCAEYALDSSLPTYAGGLGVLAGDHIQEAATRQFPLLAVGLFYQKAQNALSPGKDVDKSKLKAVTDENGQEMMVTVSIEGLSVSAKAWRWEENEAKVYLLDTNIPENDPINRDITKQLYDENRDLRLKQEIMLGIGGFRLLARLGYHPSVYHLNESHSAFLILELVRHEMEHQRVDFEKACEYAKKHILFTNHTLMPAGQELFATNKVDVFLDSCAREICLDKNDILRLGNLGDGSNLFSMTAMAFRLSSGLNTVSKLHLEKAKEIWSKQNMENITNGVFLPRWDKVGASFEASPWECHLKEKRKLLSLVREKSGEVWNERDLIFVWARRLVEYKQPLLFLEDADKMAEILKNSSVPVRIIFSGPTGESENYYAEQIKKIAEENLKGTVVFLPNYNLEIAEILTAGADVWLNTPAVGSEACGTSGMKAALNGALALSSADGWVHEVNASEIGWIISRSGGGEEMRFLLKEKIIPAWEAHLLNPENSEWAEKMKRARNLILKDFSTSRALKEYIEKFYVPILRQKHKHKVD